MRVLLTCPPMLGMKESFRPLFTAKGIELHCPEVVQTLSEDELIALLPDFDGWIIGDDPATRRVFEAGRQGRLKAAVKWGIGVDNVDFAAAMEFGIPIANTPLMFGREVADVVMSYVVALARQTYLIDRAIRAGEWLKPRGISLAGKTMALVGFGDIGKNVSRRALAADMKVIAYDPAVGANALPLSVASAVWPHRIEEADFIVFACSLNPGNRHMLDAPVLGKSKDGVRIVNVSRGPLIDEAALIAALQSKKVHSAALDVFEVEPLPAESPLRAMERCILGSHNGSNTEDAVIRASERAAQLLFDFLGVAEA
jgi:D-3-phosphoglycerate dehydrogenase